MITNSRCEKMDHFDHLCLSSMFLKSFPTYSTPHLSLGGAEPGETGETGGRPSPSLEPVLAALLLAQAFSLGGGAGITFRGSLEEPVEGGCGEAPGEQGSPSLPLKTSFSPERSLSRHRDAIGWKEKHVVSYCLTSLWIIFQRKLKLWLLFHPTDWSFDGLHDCNVTEGPMMKTGNKELYLHTLTFERTVIFFWGIKILVNGTPLARRLYCPSLRYCQTHGHLHAHKLQFWGDRHGFTFSADGWKSQ